MTPRARPLNVDSDGCAGSYLLSDFAPGSAELRAEHRSFLDERIVRILDTESASVRLTGRAQDSEPKAAQGLAVTRANGVAAHLRSKGVAKDRVQVDSAAPGALTGATGSADQRSVEITPSIAKTFRLILHDIGIVERADVAVKVIDDAMQGIVRRAGRQLRTVRTTANDAGDLTLDFLRSGHERVPCAVLFLGVEGGGMVWVGAHEDIRVCGSPTRGDDGEMDYTPTIQRVFDPSEAPFARAVANTALHEIGHLLAELEHTPDPANYLFSTDRGAVLPKAQRSRESLEELYAGPKTFNETQQRAMVCAVRSGYYAGGMRISSR